MQITHHHHVTRAILGAWAAAALLCLRATAAAPPQKLLQATEPAADRVVKTISAAEMKDLMKAAGYDSVTLAEEGHLNWQIEGFRTQVFIMKDQESMQFHAAFGDGNATMEKVNAWNRGKRYSRTYLDNEGDPHLELDLDLAGGVTEARIHDFLKTCRISFITWCVEVVR